MRMWIEFLPKSVDFSIVRKKADACEGKWNGHFLTKKGNKVSDLLRELN